MIIKENEITHIHMDQLLSGTICYCIQ